MSGNSGTPSEDRSQLTAEGIREIEAHLERIDARDWEPNVRMPQRLRAGRTESQDVHFDEHELTEAALRQTGLSQEDAHLRALEVHGIRYEPGYERHLYHPDVIREFAEWFNSAANPPP